MAVKKTILTDDGDELEYYLNDKGKLFMGVNHRDEDYCANSSVIAIDKDDLGHLIREFSAIHEEMED